MDRVRTQRLGPALSLFKAFVDLSTRLWATTMNAWDFEGSTGLCTEALGVCRNSTHEPRERGARRLGLPACINVTYIITASYGRVLDLIWSDPDLV